jgi:hypothetical protein
MTAMICWTYETRWGTFAIVPINDRFVAKFDDEDLGSYHSAEAALDELVGGNTSSLPGDLDSSKMGLPDELSGWTPVLLR